MGFLDLSEGSSIAVFSLGESRHFFMREKTRACEVGVEPQEFGVDIHHNSLCLLSEENNAHWVHGIRKTKDDTAAEAPASERGCGRIALVFRDSITFRTTDGHVLYGPRCIHRTLEEATEAAAAPYSLSAGDFLEARVQEMCQLKNIMVWNGQGMFDFVSKSEDEEEA